MNGVILPQVKPRSVGIILQVDYLIRFFEVIFLLFVILVMTRVNEIMYIVVDFFVVWILIYCTLFEII